MKRRTWIELLLGLMMLTMLVEGCRSVPAGTVKGVLLDKKGAPMAETPLQLLKVTGEQEAGTGLETSAFKTATDARGAFAFTGVEQGKYAIVILAFKAPVFSLTEGALPMPSFDLNKQLVRNKENGLLTFDVTPAKGADLGKVAWE